MPLVSVIVPTCNRAGMLERAVESVLEQTFRDFELIVVDDGSTDKTGEAIKKYSERLRYFAKKNGGVASARNLGIKKARGELVAWLDDDDFFYPQKIEKQVTYFKKHPEAGLVYTGHVTIDLTARQTRKSYLVPPLFRDCESLRNALLKHCFFANSTVMMKKECFDLAGTFDERLGHTVDYDMWLRTAAFFRFGCVPEVLAGYQWHGKQISVRRDNRILPVLRKRARELYEKHPCREVE
ncbi:MAG: glycosyltransferase family 2 protein [Bacillota bacterium]